MRFNLADLFESVVDVVPDREALVCGTDRLTYAALDAAANRFGHHLLTAGVRPGDHVGIQLYNGVEYVTALLGCVKARAVPVNVNYRYVEDELAYLFDDADLAALVFDAELADRVARAHARVPVPRLVAVGPGPLADLPAVRWADAVAAEPDSREFPARSTDDLYIIYTGGTTGMPKGVMWRQEDIFFAGMFGGDPAGQPAQAPEDVSAKLADRPAMVMFPVAPLMHGAAQLATFIAFFQGQKVVLLRRFDAAEVWRTVEREKVNTMNIVGDAMARPMADALAEGDGRPDVSSLFVISSAGAILSRAVRDQLTALLPNVYILDSFGASEVGYTGSEVPGSSPDSGLRFRANAITAVLDDALQPVAPGSAVVGRVAQRRHVPLGYYKDAAKTAQTFVEVAGERWVLLGDLARVEEDGTITVLGRASQCINTGGEKVFPEEVEAVLKGHPDVFDAVVTGVPDRAYGERVAAVVQPRTGATVTAADVERHCRDRLAGYKVPRVVVVTTSIERSPTGKPDYPWARRVAAEAAGQPA